MSFGAARIASFVLAGSLLAGLALHIATRDMKSDDSAAPPVEQSAPLHVVAGPWVDAMASVSRLASAQTAVGDGHLLFGFHMKMDDGWKTYWRNPGDSGFAPRFDWSGSQNVKSINLIWPSPSAFDEAGERFYGYKGDVIWPLKVTVEDTNKPVSLSLKLDFGICSDVCVPAEVATGLSLQAGNAEEASDAQAISEAVGLQPVLAREMGLQATVRLENIEGHRARLAISYQTPKETAGSIFNADMVIVDGVQGTYFSASQPYAQKGFHVALDTADPASLRGQSVNLVFLRNDGTPAVEGIFMIN
jgi:DsbC/DsbD-like thiol-disulfide interchange protein